MKQFTSIGIISVAVLASTALPAFAQVSTTTSATSSAATTTPASIDSQVQALLSQIQQLKAQLEQLLGTNTVSKSVAQQVKQAFELTAPLHAGMNGEEVRKLQEVLATDPTLFPKDSITGFFGPMTEEAVKQFQKHFGIDSLGIVGPHTMEKINELLKSAGVENEGDLQQHDLGNLDDNETEQGDNATSTSSGHEDKGSHDRGDNSEHGGGDN